ncbi:MAG: NADH dehydrogenase subunit L [Gammaproteobacteria bacterium]|nr:MAG: NADH dehydrogenase subunit L [Gammaproteobacteria bacterium]
MHVFDLIHPATALFPAFAMALLACLTLAVPTPAAVAWRRFGLLAGLTLFCSALAALAFWLGSARGATPLASLPWLAPGPLSAWMALLVQTLGVVIGHFSARYLEGEPGQGRYIAALAAVLAAVHLLVLADHWLLLIAAWAAVGVALRHLLCFYAERPFAQLAAHKKQLADRLADLLLLAAAVLAWIDVGSGRLSALWPHLAQHGAGTALAVGAVCLAAAVILRTALLPVHGWLIQVMEAPTPVSALLHAGVVNLGGFVLLRTAPLLEAVPAARWLLIGFGLATAVLAGLAMLTRISIKVRLAWSTAAQMGFMVLECGLGLYTMAALHLIGHSLYKAHTFLSAASIVRQSRLLDLQPPSRVCPPSLALAPLLAAVPVALLPGLLPWSGWPWWWCGVLALAWAPLLWWPAGEPAAIALLRLGGGLLLATLLTLAAHLAHVLPLGVHDAPQPAAGVAALIGMAALYLVLAVLQWRPHALETWRRWSYAGFYVDEYYTRLALWLWPVDWGKGAAAVATPTTEITQVPR